MASDPTATVAEVVDRLVGWLRRLMPPEPRVDRLVEQLGAHFGGVDSPMSEADCRAVERCAWAFSRHLELHFDPAGTAPPDQAPPGGPAPDAAAVRARAAGVSTVRRLPDGTCLIAVDALEPLGIALPFIDAAFAFADGAERILLDLRANGGGDPGTVAAIAGRLLGERSRQLSEVIYADRRRQWWTPELPAGAGLRQETTVLVSARTYSSAEALAYHLQARGRVRVVGEVTPGAADHITPVRLAGTVLGLLPEAFVRDTATGGNWEGVGVQPDVACSAGDAVETALRT